LIVLITGGSGAGKTTLAASFGGAVVRTDWFYVGKSRMTPTAAGEFDFDDPTWVDLHECRRAVERLAAGEAVRVPIYDMSVSERVGEQTVEPHPSGVVVVEGIFAFHPPLDAFADLRVFIDCPAQLRLSRRLDRDTARGRAPGETLRIAPRVEESHRRVVEPMRVKADLIVRSGG